MEAAILATMLGRVVLVKNGEIEALAEVAEAAVPEHTAAQVASTEEEAVVHAVFIATYGIRTTP